MQNIKDIFTKDVVLQYKQNKNNITPELLQQLRSFGNTGKQLALDILDIEKDHEQYYLDAYGSRISFNGNRRLKKSFTKLALSEIHRKEIEKCSEDIHYFKDNYVKIKTQTGINFPDLREYQDNFLESILPDDNEDNIGICPRQSGKTVTVAIYLAHQFNFSRTFNVGITANKGKQAREFLASTKSIIIEIPIWMQLGVSVWNKSSIENEAEMRILTDVPSSDSFRGFTIAILIVDECAFIRPNVWDEFADSIFPSQSALAWKKNIIISTAKGMNHFYDLVKGAREKTNGFNIFEVDWKDVPRYRSDGSLLTNEEFQQSVIEKHGVTYFNQNYGNEFLGSSYTLITTEKLQQMKSQEPEEIRDGKLNIYHYPEKGHQYIMTVDASKEGIDAFAVQVIDITDFKFVQSASAKLQIDYLLMPEFINEWCEYYNNPYLIIENNEGAGQSIADQMFNDYEYENLHYDRKADSNQKNITKSRKGYPGFRTTPKSRKQILQTLKLFIENDNLEISDSATINEFYRFILIKNKYQADEGYHDDMIMSLALVFVPFVNAKNFEDMKLLIQNLYTEDVSQSEKFNFGEMLTIGSFDDGTDEEHFPKKEKFYNWNGIMIGTEGFV